MNSLAQRITPAFVGTLTLAGCAALHIDVDVYKGPLANEPAIQDDQFPAMLPAAKALLVRLRRSLDPITEARFETGDGRQGGWVQDYDSTLLGAQAVNNILYLYEDEPAVARPEWFLRLQTLARGFADSWNLALGEAEPAYSELVSAMKLSLTGSAAQCAAEFRNFLNRSYAASGEWSVSSLVPACKPTLQESAHLVQDETFPDENDNAIFFALRRKEPVTTLAALLYTDSTARDRFVAAVQNKANAYVRGREALHSLWAQALAVLITSGASQVAPENRLSEGGRRALAHLVALATQPQFLDAYFCTLARNSDTAGLELQRLLTRYAGTSQAWAGADHQYSKAEAYPYEEADSSLQKLLVDEPTEASKLLLDADEGFRTRPQLCAYGSPKRESPAKHAYGIVRGLSFGPSGLSFESSSDSLEVKILRGLQRVKVAVAGGLESGRLHDGLDTVLQEYLLARTEHEADFDDPVANSQRERLRIQVVQFAEKLLVLTNNEQLFNEVSRKLPKSDNGLAEAEKKEKEEAEAREKKTLQVTSSRGTEYKKYVPLLQAIANSLLVQAQELQSLAADATKLKQNGATESAALDGSLNAAAYLDRVLADLDADPTAPVEPLDESTVGHGGPSVADAAGAVALSRHSRSNRSVSVDATLSLQQKAAETVAERQGKTDAASAALALVTGGDAPSMLAALKNANARDRKAEVTAVQLWIDATLGRTGQVGDTRHNQLIAARSYFTDLRDEPSVARADTVDAAFKALIAQIKKDTVALGQKLARAKEAKAAADRQVQIQTKLAASIGTADAATSHAQGQARAGNSQSVTQQDALVAIQSKSAAVLAALIKTKTSDSAAAAYFAMLSELQTGVGNNPAGGVVVTPLQCRAARAYLLKRGPPGGIVANGASKQTSAQVLDSLIASLRYKYILATSKGTSGKGEADAAKAALELALDFRGGLQHIRPASSYLRSVYTTTAFQDSAGVQWRNLLSDEARRGSPLFSEWLVRKFGDKTPEELKGAEENDRQAWQTINTVKVTGAGRTNYVITKDDVGNWYVKTYVNDTRKITSGALKLGLFSLGGASANPTLLKSISGSDASGTTPSDGMSAARPGGTTQNQGSPAGVEGMVAKYRSAYDKATDNDFTAATALDARLHDDVAGAWEKNPQVKDAGGAFDEFKADLKVATDELAARLAALKKAVKEKPADNPKGQQIVLALEATKTAYITLAAKMRGHTDVQPNVLQAALLDARRTIREAITTLAQSRQRTVQAFVTAVTFAGQAK